MIQRVREYLHINKYLFPAKYDKERYLLLFITCAAAMLICFLPSLIINKGIFLYYGDFNSQQEMFYYHSNEMIKNGNFGWDWGTDLGSSFIGSYSFYLLGSPFFWLTTIFPPSAEVYMIPVMLAVKTGMAAVFAYAYIRLFAEDKDAAFIGALLYAMSGFQIYNVFFNHFHDATAVFPLLLYGMEVRMREGRRGVFAAAVAICAMISYFFFFGEVIFCIIYFLIRLISGEYEASFRKFGGLAFEAVIGVMIAAVIFLPACLDTINNPRLNEHLWGLDLVAYNDKLRILRIIESFFILPDMPARPNIFSADTAKWASIAGYMPLFSMVGVIAFVRTKRSHWASRIVKICFIMMFIPGLNAIYAMMTASYYARWYYMPILIMAMMTAKTAQDEPEEMKKAYPTVAVITVALLLCGLLPTYKDEKVEWLKLPGYNELYIIQAAAAVVLLTALAILLYRYAGKENFLRVASFMTSGACIVCMAVCVWYGVCQGPYNDYYIEHAINGGESIDLTEFETDKETNAKNGFYRIDTSPNVDNWCMFWGLSSMRCFQSVVPSSIMEFYETLGLERNVASRIETKYYALRGLFSVKYYFEECVDMYSDDNDKEAKDHLSDMQTFSYVGTQNGFNIYKNEQYVPMGFMIDSYISKEDFEKLSTPKKCNTLMHALVLSDENIEKYSSLLTECRSDGLGLSYDDYNRMCEEKRATACDSFVYDTDGFTAHNNAKKDGLVFFSVPYTKGWSAEVNGEPADIVIADYGFMAVECGKGENEIVFSYETPGLKVGKVMTFVGLILLTAYYIVFKVLDKRKAD